MNWKNIVEYESFGSAAGDSAVAALETRIGVRLPDVYREFMLTDGGGDLYDGLTECTVPTPFGRHNITVLHELADILDLLDSSVAPRNMICIGYGHFGMTTCLSVAGIDHGHVYALDTEMRFFWDEEQIAQFPDLDPTIKEFFRMRDADELPQRPWGYDNCYHIADSFHDFLSKLHVHSD